MKISTVLKSPHLVKRSGSVIDNQDCNVNQDSMRIENLSQFLKNAASKNADKVALQKRDTSNWQRLTYRQLDEASSSLAKSLNARGFKAGDHIAILGESRPEWVTAFFAIHKLGGVCIPIDKFLKQGDLEPILKRSEAKLVIASKNYIPTLSGLSLSLPIISMDKGDPAYPSLEQEVQSGKSLPDIKESSAKRDSTAVIIFTSGTTGNPKGVMLSHGNLLSNVESLTQMFPEELRGGPSISILPLNHAFEMTGGLLAPIANGGQISYVDPPTPPNITQAFVETKSKQMLVVPLILERLKQGLDKKIEGSSFLQRMKFKTAFKLAWFLPFPAIRRRIFKQVHNAFGGELKCFMSGGAPLSGNVEDAFERMGFKVMQGYGMTEASPVLTVNPYEKSKRFSVGKPIPGVEVIIDGKDKEGEILAQGPNIMQGYYKDPVETQKVLRDGWLHTGDLGHFDREGYLYISGRIKDMIVLENGKKVFPEEIEDRLKGARYVKEVCVLGLKHGEAEEIAAVIIPDEKQLTANLIRKEDVYNTIWKEIEKINNNIANFKSVRKLILWEGEFPKTTTMKVKRRELQKLVESKRSTAPLV